MALSLAEVGSEVAERGLNVSSGLQRLGGDEEEAAEVRPTGDTGTDGGRSGKDGGVSGTLGAICGGRTGGPETACCIKQWILNQFDLRPYLEPDFDMPTMRHFLSLHALHAVRFFLLMTHL